MKAGSAKLRRFRRHQQPNELLRLYTHAWNIRVKSNICKTCSSWWFSQTHLGKQKSCNVAKVAGCQSTREVMSEQPVSAGRATTSLSFFSYYKVVKFGVLEPGIPRKCTFCVFNASFSPLFSHRAGLIWLLCCSVSLSCLLLCSLKLRWTLVIKFQFILRTNGLPVRKTNSIQLHMVGGQVLMEDDRSPHSVSYV